LSIEIIGCIHIDYKLTIEDRYNITRFKYISYNNNKETKQHLSKVDKMINSKDSEGIFLKRQRTCKKA
jgi:ATP-dependent RNA circularization protein (DNA/RNA ligase family)